MNISNILYHIEIKCLRVDQNLVNLINILIHDNIDIKFYII